MLSIHCIACQSYLPILTKEIRGHKSYSYAYCIRCGIKIDGIQKGSDSLQKCGEDVSTDKFNKEVLEWLRKKTQVST